METRLSHRQEMAFESPPATIFDRTGGSIPRKQIKRNGKLVYVDEATFDPNPLYAENSIAFDPRYGPPTQECIDAHIKRGTPGATEWEVGKPAKPFDRT